MQEKVVLASLASGHQKQAQHLRRRIATLLRGGAEVKDKAGAGEEEEEGAVPNRRSLCWKSSAQAAVTVMYQRMMSNHALLPQMHQRLGSCGRGLAVCNMMRGLASKKGFWLMMIV